MLSCWLWRSPFSTPDRAHSTFQQLAIATTTRRVCFPLMSRTSPKPARPSAAALPGVSFNFFLAFCVSQSAVRGCGVSLLAPRPKQKLKTKRRRPPRDLDPNNNSVRVRDSLLSLQCSYVTPAVNVDRKGARFAQRGERHGRAHIEDPLFPCSDPTRQTSRCGKHATTTQSRRFARVLHQPQEVLVRQRNVRKTDARSIKCM